MNSLNRFQKIKIEAPVDGDNWLHYKLIGEGDLWITSRGRDLLKNPDFRRKISQYKRDYRSRRETEIRQPFDAGQNSDVFKLNGTRVLVKERKQISTESLVESLQSMDILQYVIRGKNNEERVFWYDLPDHYGAFDYEDGDGKKQSFLLVEEIGDGVTLQDTQVEYSSLSPSKKEKFDLLFGDITEGERQILREDLYKQYRQLSGILDVKKAQFKEKNPKLKEVKIFRDSSKLSNFVIEKIDPPKNGKKFKFWIIDQ